MMFLFLIYACAGNDWGLAMFVEDWWITPDGVVNMAAAEHAQYALYKMSSVRVPTRDIWLIPDQYLRQMSPEIVAYLKSPGADPRKYAIKYWGWVRVARNVFNLNRFDDATLTLLRNAKDFWRAQYAVTEYDICEIEEIANHRHIQISVGDLRSNKSAGTLLGWAQPAEAAVEPVKFFPKKSGPQTGEKWQYRYPGDNPEEE